MSLVGPHSVLVRRLSPGPVQDELRSLAAKLDDIVVDENIGFGLEWAAVGTAGSTRADAARAPDCLIRNRG